MLSVFLDGESHPRSPQENHRGHRGDGEVRGAPHPPKPPSPSVPSVPSVVSVVSVPSVPSVVTIPSPTSPSEHRDDKRHHPEFCTIGGTEHAQPSNHWDSRRITFFREAIERRQGNRMVPRRSPYIPAFRVGPPTRRTGDPDRDRTLPRSGRSPLAPRHRSRSRSDGWTPLSVRTAETG